MTNCVCVTLQKYDELQSLPFSRELSAAIFRGKTGLLRTPATVTVSNVPSPSLVSEASFELADAVAGGRGFHRMRVLKFLGLQRW